jgi:hypothetical protein
MSKGDRLAKSCWFKEENENWRLGEKKKRKRKENWKRKGDGMEKWIKRFVLIKRNGD